MNILILNGSPKGENSVTLIDLMGRRCTVEGSLLKASLTDGYVILKTE